MNANLIWINSFVRDLLLAFVLIYINYNNNFSSWWLGLITGMFITYVSWKLQDYYKLRRTL